MQTSRSNEPRFNTPDFTLENFRLTIHTTDANEGEDYEPPQEVKVGSGNSVTWFELQPLSSPASKRLRKVLAKELVNMFLLIGLGDTTTDYILADFPPGYRLYSHKKGTRAGHDDVRQDGYIFGAGYRFRSAREALFHFAWLMRGMPEDRCMCVYDTPIPQHKRKQGVLNAYLMQEWRKLLDERARRRAEANRATLKDKIPRNPFPSTLNVFNDACFLLPEQREQTP